MKKIICLAALGFALAHSGVSFASIFQYSQTCSNGDQFRVNRKTQTLSITRKGVTWAGKYDERGKVTWNVDNPPVPAGLRLPNFADVTEEGTVFRGGTIDDLSLCAIDQ